MIHRPKGSRSVERQDDNVSSVCTSVRAGSEHKDEAFELSSPSLPVALVRVFDAHHVLDQPYLARSWHPDSRWILALPGLDFRRKRLRA